MAFRDKIVPLVFTTALLGGAGYFIATAKGPCEEAIPYRIGTIDPRFGITREQLEKAASEASAVWIYPGYPRLFRYDPKAEMAINLVFDWRQQSTQAGLSEVDRIKKLQAELKTMEDGLLPRRDTFERSARAFSRRLAQFNARVERWNATQGAEGDRDDILREERTLREQERTLGRENDRLNQLIERHNKLVADINNRIEALKRNVLNGVHFEKGLYSEPGGKPRVDIYQFEAVADLVLTLAHEFGHALGLPHGMDPKSLMFPYLLSQKGGLSDEDLRLLKAYCST